MLDGRIDTQGTIVGLQAQGILEDIEHSALIEAHKAEALVDSKLIEETVDSDTSKPEDKVKKPRKLVKDEHRETGGVKWSVYKSYLKAS